MILLVTGRERKKCPSGRPFRPVSEGFVATTRCCLFRIKVNSAGTRSTSTVYRVRGHRSPGRPRSRFPLERRKRVLSHARANAAKNTHAARIAQRARQSPAPLPETPRSRAPAPRRDRGQATESGSALERSARRPQSQRPAGSRPIGLCSRHVEYAARSPRRLCYSQKSPRHVSIP